jgi:flagellar biosynthesis/type III secretory pathway protein FliH
LSNRIIPTSPSILYRARAVEEQSELREVVDRSLQKDPHRKELTKMGRTIAEMYIDQGRALGRDEGRNEGRAEGEQNGKLESARTILLRLLRRRVKRVPPKIEARVAATTSMDDLQNWLDNVIDAKTLAAVGIPQE